MNTGSALANSGPSAPVASVAGQPANDATHPLVMQQTALDVASARTGSLEPFRIAAPRAAVGGSGGLQREVFGFGLLSSLNSTTYGYPTWNFGLLTTVAVFGLHVQADGHFAADSGWNVWNSSQMTDLMTRANAAGTKVVVTIILQDFCVNDRAKNCPAGNPTPDMCAGLANRAATVDQTYSEVLAKGVAGVNIDYEGLQVSCANGVNPRVALADLATRLRAKLPPGSYLSVDTYASSASDPAGFFDIPALNPSTDAFFVMAYDSEYSNWHYPPLNCPSFCLGPTAPLASYHYNDTIDVSQYLSVVAPSKVLLGVPYYGRKSCVNSPSPNQVPTGPVTADMYVDAATENMAGPTLVQPGSYVAHRDGNDPSGQERWDTWFSPSLNCQRELYWDDATSLGLKYDLINSNHLRGVGIWNLNFGGGSPELWNLLSAKFANTVNLGGYLTSGPDAAAMSATHSDVFVRGTDNGLWHKWWTGSAWSEWEDLGGILTSDPGAVSWGPNRVDVFVRGTDAGLWHKWWDTTGWHGWESLGGVLTSSPDVASRGNGILDVVVRGADNGVWHKWWDPGGWHGWETLGGVLTSDPSTVSWGSSDLEIFGRGTDNGLWRRSWDGAHWNSWQSLGGVLTTGPDASSCAASKLDVFALGTDNGLWRESWTGTAWTPWQSVGGRWTSDPSAVCVPGTSNIQVFERGTDGALWYLALAG
jgi:spore germination protein YaaH